MPRSGARRLSQARNTSPRGRSGCCTERPSSVAASLTGGGMSTERERPWGRSGWVTTPSTSMPSATRARSDGTANAGVPKYTTRIGSAAVGGRLERFDHVLAAMLLLVPGQEKLSLERTQVVDEQDPVEMVDFMLDAARDH